MRVRVKDRSTQWAAAGGAFVVSLDSMVNIAFPSIAAVFAVPPEQIRWVIICYVLMYAVVSFVGGAAGDRVGHGRVFQAGLAGSALAFVLGGAAPTFGWLLLARVVQGLSAGLVYGTAPGIVALGAPPESRGRALGFLNAAIGFTFTAGPILSGQLIHAFGWRAIFYVRAPVALAALAWALRGLPTARRGAAGRRLLSIADVTRPPVLRAGALAFLAHAAIFAIWLLAPFYLVERRGFDARVGGVLFMLTPLGTAIAAPLAGRAVDRMGARAPVVAGLLIETAGLALMARADPATSAVTLALALFGAGLGLGIFQVPNMAEVMAAFPAAQQGAAGGLAFLARTLGVVGGVVTLAAVFAARRVSVGVDRAFTESFVVAAVLVGGAAAVALVPRQAAAGR